MATGSAAVDSDAVLSDVEEGDDSAPTPVTNPPNQDDISVDRFRELLAELDRERAAREAAEASKSNLQVSFNRLKALAHEAIKKRDELGRQRDEALREKDEALKDSERMGVELDEVSKSKEVVVKQLEETCKVRDALQSEIENSRHMLVTGIEKISGKVSNFKDFSGAAGGGGLPRSQKYTGFASVAYGVIKRTNEIVEELVKQIDSEVKSRNEAREHVDRRNYEIAIEVSQLEATIAGLRDEVAKKAEMVEGLERRVEEVERESSEKLISGEKEVMMMQEKIGEYDETVTSMKSRIEFQMQLLADQLNLVAKIHDELYGIIKIVDMNHSDSEVSESLFLPQQVDTEENIRASLAGMESIYELTRVVVEKTRNLVEEKSSEVTKLVETVDQLVKEKEHIGSLLRSALSKRMKLDASSKTSELFQTAENGLREAGIDFNFSKVLGDGNVSSGPSDKEEDEIYTLAGALENIVKTSQLEIIELRHSGEELRAELGLLKDRLESQAKELSLRMRKIEELEEKERVANDSVEGLMTDIAAAEEEITRWKVAAEQEAAAGRAVEQEFVAQLLALKQELEEAKQTLLESEKKVKFKEETSAAAMAAREAAQNSLRLADVRASGLRDRLEELTRQLEEYETREDSRNRNSHRYVCWPWQWLGLDFVGVRQAETREQSSNEMELSEPLL